MKSEIRIRQLEKARAQLKQAEEKFIAHVRYAYPVGTLIRYTTSGYIVLYRVLEYRTNSARMKVKRAFMQNGTERCLDGGSTCISFYQEGAENR